MRSVIASGANVDPSKEKRDSLILNESGLITVTGGKLTTFRSTAVAALKKAAEVVPGLKAPNAELPLFAPPATSTVDALSDLPADLRERWLARYGDAAAAVKACAAANELQTIRQTGTATAELRWACHSEDVVHLDDLLLRRARAADQSATLIGRIGGRQSVDRAWASGAGATGRVTANGTKP